MRSARSEWIAARGPATVAGPRDQEFCYFGVNRAGGVTVAPPCDLGFPASEVNRGAVDSTGPSDLGNLLAR